MGDPNRLLARTNRVFSNLGFPEVVLLAVIGLILFGPDRLPKAIADAARMVRQVRAAARSATSDLKAELGPELSDLDLASLHPRRLVNDHLLGED